MRILYLTYDDLRRHFAWTTHVSSIVSGLRARGHEVLLVAPNGRAGSRLGRRLWYLAGDLPQMLRVARRFRPQAVYLRGAQLSPVPGLVSGLEGVPLVVEINGLVEHEEVGSFRRGLYRVSQRWYLARASRVVTVSEMFRQGLHRLYGVPLWKVAVIENGADLRRFRPEVAPAGLAREPGDLVGLFVGSFYPHHHLPLLIEAGRRAMRREPRLRVVLVGDGPERRLAEAQAAGGRFTFLGEQPYEAVPGLIAASDFGVFALKRRYRYYGPSTIKLYEFMAMARACVVATDVVEVAEFINSKGVGLAVPPDPEAFAEAMVKVAGDAARRSEWGRNGRALCEEVYNWDRAARQVEEVLRAVV